MSFLLGLLVGTEVTILNFLEKQIDSRNNLYLELKALLEFRHFFSQLWKDCTYFNSFLTLICSVSFF